MDTFFAQYPERPQVPTLTMGGNDLGFTPMIQDCVLSDCSDSEPLHTKIQTMQSGLASLYGDVRSAHPYADVLVGGYPNDAGQYHLTEVFNGLFEGRAQ